MAFDRPRTVIDLTHALVPGQVPACAGHPCYTASPCLSLAAGEFANVHALTLGTHTGTHIDAPYHFFADGVTVDRLDLTLLSAAPAVVADLRGKRAHERIVWADLADAAEEVKARGARVLLLCTGWSRHWNTETYSAHPFVDADAARRLLDLGVKVLGLDTMSPDKVTADEECADVHHVVLGSGGIIVENLTGLETIVDGGWKQIVVSLLPLSLAGCDGSPIRAVAWEGDA
ncbi:putative cyclase [Trametes versicolor FP-101664 SS1]|uniref:putative cyclase n=1 Tax=Trametes versicolor (strain FP-101664) TaxID=717944 RepID=UPI0004622815|nr:putative cyclase [Trametes versicolor FP-101664 SS1]EIW54004.1 putative cyclase [Trametes versicolor FP-101664 SS1]